MAEVADTVLGVPIGVVTGVQGAAGVVAHPVDAFKGAVHLVDRVAQTTPEGRTFEFMAELAMGKYSTPGEAFQALREKTDGGALLGAKLELAKDVTAAVFGESIQLAKEGRYGAALGILLGENIDLALGGLGAVKGAQALRRMGKAADIGNEARKVVDIAADATKTADRAAELGKTTRASEGAQTLERTSAGSNSSRIQSKNTVGVADVPPSLKPWESKYWKPQEVQGTKVYQRNDLIDPARVDSMGRTNLQRMQKGLSPLGPDGKPVNLHHVIQTPGGPLAEVTQSFHQQFKTVLHVNPNKIPSGINRSVFDAWRAEYWKRRALDFASH